MTRNLKPEYTCYGANLLLCRFESEALHTKAEICLYWDPTITTEYRWKTSDPGQQMSANITAVHYTSHERWPRCSSRHYSFLGWSAASSSLLEPPHLPVLQTSAASPERWWLVFSFTTFPHTTFLFSSINCLTVAVPILFKTLLLV